MRFVPVGEALDGGHRGAVSGHRKDRAGLGAAAVDEDRARSTVTRIAADVRAREAGHVADEIDEQQPRLDVCRDGPAVYLDADRPRAHDADPRPSLGAAVARSSADESARRVISRAMLRL